MLTWTEETKRPYSMPLFAVFVFEKKELNLEYIKFIE